MRQLYENSGIRPAARREGCVVLVSCSHGNSGIHCCGSVERCRRPDRITAGLVAFGVVFAMNSSINSYRLLAFTQQEDVSLNVGFYYMANV